MSWRGQLITMLTAPRLAALRAQVDANPTRRRPSVNGRAYWFRVAFRRRAAGQRERTVSARSRCAGLHERNGGAGRLEVSGELAAGAYGE